ncbi:MAG: hypothetical protein ACOC1F_10325, partial [Myxococcota bacterium]
LAIYDRSQRGRPDTSWWRHVNRVVAYDVPSGDFVTVGGNERQKVNVDTQHLDNVKLLGFVAYPQGRPRIKPILDSNERAKISHLVFQSIDGMLRDAFAEAVSLHEDDEPDGTRR